MTAVAKLVALKLQAARRDVLRHDDDTSNTDMLLAGINKAARYVSDAFAGLQQNSFDRDEFMAIVSGTRRHSKTS
jgi:hypothetical protein